MISFKYLFILVFVFFVFSPLSSIKASSIKANFINASSIKANFINAKSTYNKSLLFGKAQSKAFGLLWNIKTPYLVYASPLIKDDMIFYGDVKNNFYALSAYTGKLLWTFKLKSRYRNESKGIRGSFVVYNDNILVYNVDGFLYSFNMKTGNIVFGPLDIRGDIFSRPVFYDKYIFIVSGLGGRIRILSAATGKQYKLNRPMNIGYPVYTSPLISDVFVEKDIKDVLYNIYISLSNKLVVFRVNMSSKTREHVKTLELYNKYKYISSPVLHKKVSKKSDYLVIKTLFLVTKTNIFSIDATLLKVNWINKVEEYSFKEDVLEYPSPYVRGDKVYFFTRGYEIENGSPFWNVFMKGWPTVEARYTYDKIYLAGRYISDKRRVGFISVLEIKTESVRNFLDIFSEPLSPVAVNDGLAALSTFDKRLLVFR